MDMVTLELREPACVPSVIFSAWGPSGPDGGFGLCSLAGSDDEEEDEDDEEEDEDEDDGEGEGEGEDEGEGQ